MHDFITNPNIFIINKATRSSKPELFPLFIYYYNTLGKILFKDIK